MKFKWNFPWLFWFFSNSIGLAKPNKCQRLFPSAIYDLPKCFVLRCCLIWYGFLCWTNETICHAFLNRRKVFVIEGRQGSGKLVAHNSLLGLSLSLSLSVFVYLRYAYTSIIQMCSQQEASSCGLSRGLAQAALNPFSSFAFTFVLLCFACIYLALCLEALPLREAGSRAARGSSTLMGKLMGKQFHAFCNGSRVAVCRSQWQMELWSVGRKGRRGVTQGEWPKASVCSLFYFICKTDKVRLSSFKQILKCLRVEIFIKCIEMFRFKYKNINNFFIYNTITMKFGE